MSSRVSLLSYVNSFYDADAMPGACHVGQAVFDMKLIGMSRGTVLRRIIHNQFLHNMADLGDVLLQTIVQQTY